MNFNIEQEIGARFKLIAHKENGEKKETKWFKNIVLNSGLERMSVNTWISQCCVGTGNSTPAPTQINLDSFVASTRTILTKNTNIQVTTKPYYVSVTLTWRFGQGIAAGNLSEVGLGWGDKNLWNRALIRDENGNPTTITVLNDEYLDVISEVRVYPANELNGSFKLLDKYNKVISEHTYIGLPYLYRPTDTFGQVKLGSLAIYTGEIGTSVTSSPTGQAATQAATATTTYPTATSCKTVMQIALASANMLHKSFEVRIDGLLSVSSAPYIGYKLQIDPPITKNSSQIMTYTFKLGWSRYEGIS